MAILGTVVSINGSADAVSNVFVVSQSGEKRVLQLNDGINPGDTIITPKGVIVDLALINDKTLAIFAEQSVQITQELVDSVPPGTGDSAIDQATIQAVITAINEGRDIGEVLEEAAAGLDGGATTAYGFSFENLSRIVESLNPVAFDFESNRDETVTIEPLFSEQDDLLIAGAGGGLGGGGTSTPPSIAIDDIARNEGAGTITFAVSLTTPSATPVMVDYTAASGTATVGTDITAGTSALSDTLTFAPGTTTQTITLNITNDTVFEGPETFDIDLTNPTGGATIGDNRGVGTIADDGTGPGGTNDDTPSITLTGIPVVNEAAGTITYTATLSNTSDLPVSVDYNTANGSATDGADFTGASGTLNFAAGVTVQTFTVDITEDTVYEGPEDFTANLTNPSNATIAVGTLTTTINDDGTGDPNGNPPTDDRPTVATVSDPSVTEGGDLDYVVTLSNTSTTPTTVTLTPSNGTGTLGTDTGTPIEVSFNGGTSFTTYTGPTVDVPAGVISFITRIPTTDDAISETNETILLDANTSGQAPVTGTGTITDNDTVNIIIDDVARNEGAGTITFTVSLTTTSVNPVTVDYAAASGTATVGTDITAGTSALSDTLTFAPGATSQTITLNITNDTVFEASESFNIDLTNATGGAVIGDAQGVGTITDDGTGPGGTNDDTPSITLTGIPVVNEAAGTITYTATLSNTSDLPVSVDYNTANGSATDGADFTGASGTLNFAAGVTVQTFTVDITEDTVYEGPEDFTANLTNPSNATIAVGTLTTTINDDGTGDPNGNPPTDDTTSFSIGDVSISEGGLMTFTVTRTGDAEAAQTIDFATGIGGGDTAEVGDFTGNTGTLSFATGVTSQTFTVQTTQDAAYEGAETFTATLSNNSAGSTIADATATGTILDDGTGPGPFDPGPGADDDTTSFSIGDVSISEGGLMTFTVTRTGDAEAAQTIDFATGIGGGDTAEVGDFTGNTGTLSFATGVTSQTFTVQTTQDAAYEGAETFTATLSNNSAGSTIADATATGTILDDGTGPGPFDPGPGADDDTTSFSIGDVSISEGGLMTFTVTRTGDAEAAQTIDFATGIGGGDTAEVGDFTGNTGTLSFATGVTSQTFTVQTTQDAAYEGAETFTATLSNNSAGSTIADATATGTILDDGTGPGPFDPGPGADDDTTSFSIGDVSISEGGLMTFTVTRTGDAEAAQTIDFATGIGGGDTAEVGDFTGNTGTLSFATGVTSQTFTVQTTQDAAYEGAETFTATLSNNSAGSTIADATATGTILDDGTGPGPFDPGPGADDDTTSFSIGDVSISEGGLMTFTVTRTGDAEAAQTIDFATGIGGGDTAEVGDFTGNTGTLSFATGVTSQTFTVQTTQDAAYEGAETFTATLSNNSAGSTIADATATGTILDDGTGPGPFDPGPGADDDTTSFSIGDVSISEGGLMTFTVTRTGDAEAAQTIDFATGIGGGDTAEVGDFTGNTGTLSFATGVTSQTFTVQTTQDAAYEGAETFTATLSNNSAGSTIADATATGTILDDGTGPGPFDPGPGADDDRPTVATVSDPSVTEGGDLDYVVTLSNTSTTPTTVTLTPSNGTGTLGTDTGTPIEVSFNGGTSFTTYTGPTVDVPAGVISFITRIPTTDDAISETNETILLDANTSGQAPVTGTGTITDNDTVNIIIDDVARNEGAGTITFTVSLTTTSVNPVTVDYAAASGTATVGTDITAGTSALSDTLTFAPGATSQTITLNITNDTVFEASESFNIDLTNATGGAVIGDAQGVGTITDDGTGPGGTNDDTPSITLTGIPVVNEAAGTITYTATLSNTSDLPVSVDYNTANGSATDGADFTGASGTLNFAAGVTVQTFTVDITEDTVYEGPEDFTANLTNPSNATIAVGTLTTTINDDGTGDPNGNPPTDDTTSFSIGDVSISEGGLMTFTVTRTGDAEAAQTIDFATGIGGGDTAEVGDFTGNTGTLSFATGVTSQTFTVQTTQDAAYEGAETFTATLSNNSAGSTIADATATGTILDDGTGPGPFDPGPGADDDTTSFSIGDVSISEGGLMTFTVTRTGDAEAAQTIDFATGIGGGDTAEVGDFTGNTGTLSFATGVTSQTFTVQTTQDAAYEGAETFTATLSNNSAGSTIADATATGTILDDGTGPGPFDPGPGADDDTTSFSIGDVSISEGGLMTFTVTRTGDAEAAQTIDFATGIGGGDTAEVGDFTGNTGTLSFATGVTSQTFTVQTTQDAAYEGAETFTATLSNNSAGSTIADATATGTILDDGTGPGPFDPGPGADDDTTSFSIGDVSISEGGLMTFTVTRTGDAEAAQTIDFATGIGGGDTAEVGDFTGNTGTLSFATGVTSQTFTVQTTQDAAYEGAETFTATLSNNSAGSTIADATATGTILDDGTGPGPFDPGPGADDDTTSFSIGDVSISEGGLMTFTVTRTGDAEAAQTIDFATGIGGGDTAEVGDFTGNTGTLSFATGVTSQTFTVQTTQDAAYEGAETFTATLSNNSAGSTIADATATGTILDDGTGPGPFDPGPGADDDTTSFSIGDVSISEGGLMTFTVTRTGDAEAAQTIDFATGIGGGDTAEVGDFTGNTGTLSFATGVTSQTFTVQTTQDAAYEGAETFTATLSNNSAGSTIADATATGTILDDGTGPGPFDPGPGADDDTTSFSIGDVSISEGGLMTFTVTRTGDAEAAQTIDFATGIGGGDTAEVGDFTGNTGTLSFATGVTSQTFTVQTTQDAAYEGAETFTATLSNNSAGSTIADATATGTILDDGTGPGPFDPGPGADDDTTSFSIGDVSISEGGLMTFTVTRTGDAEAAQTIDFATGIGGGDTAEVGDFTGNTGTLSFATGVTSQTFTVQTTQDAAYEGAETFTATLSNNSAGSTIADATATGTILDDGTGPGPFDPGPGADDDTTSFSIGDVSISEGGLMTFTVTRTGDAEAAQTIDFATGIGGGDTAEVGDFTGNTGTLSFATGVTSQTFTVQTTQDAAYEGAETFTATLSNNSAGSTIADATATGTILDDGTGPGPFDPGPGADDDTTSFSIGDVSISEGGLMTFTVTRTGDAEAAQTIDFATGIGGGDTAEVGDFTGNTGTLSFATGVTSQTFTVQTTQDAAYEGAETFTATLSNNSAGSTIADATATGTILDDGTGPGPFDPGPGADDDTTSFSIGDVSISEGGLMTFTVTRTGDAEAAQTIDFATGIGGGDTAEVGDFTGNTGTLSFATGVTSQTFTVQTTQDAAYEGAETFTATLSNNSAGSTIADATATGTILDDGTGPGPFDPGPGADDDTTSFSIGDVSISEGGLMTFTVTRTGDAEAAQTIDFATGIGGGDTAEVGDFTGNTGTLSFATGVTSQTFTVQTTQDAAYEGAETFTATLSNNSAGSTIADATATGTILDDGTGPGPFDPGPGADDDTTSFSIGDVSISEGGLMTFTVTRTGDAEAAQTIDFATGIGGGDTAEVGDFTGNTGTLSFATGVTSQTFTVQTTQDAAYEGAETFTATLSNNSAGSTIADATATGTILDDGTGPGPFDPGPGADDDTTSFSIGDVSISEGGLMTFTVTRTGDAEAAQTIDFATGIGGGDTAEVGDFTGNTGTLSFATGVTSQTFTVQTTQDAAYEGAETFTATLSNNSAGSTIADATATGTILDDGTGPGPFDPGPGADDDTTSFSIGDVSISEGGLMTFTVTRTGDAEAAQTIDFATGIGGGDTAEVGDFTGNTGTLSFATGVTSQTFTVQTTQDAAYEGAETFTATLSNNSAGSTIADATATGTILDDGTGPGPFDPGPGADDDTPSITLTGIPVVNEAAGTITYTATLSNTSDLPVTVDYNTASGSAAQGSDFTGAAGTLTFAAGTTVQTFTVDITEDTVFEGPEDFTANLTNPSNATIAVGTVTTTINDDGTGDPNGNPPTDDRPTVASVTDPTITEGGDLDYVVTLSNTSTTPTTVTLTPSNGTGTLGTDTGTPIEVSFNGGTSFTTYTGPTVDVPAGVISFITRIPTTDDAISEGNETILLSASTAQNIGTVTGTGTINDNEPTIDLDGDDSSGATNSGYNTTFTENLAAVSVADVDIDVVDPILTNMVSATITLTNAQAGDVLQATTMLGITASVVGNVVTLTGSSSLANYEAAIQAVTFSNTTENPDTTPRVIEVVVNNGTDDTNTAIATVNVVAVNDAPVNTLPGALIVDEDTPLSIAGLSIADVDADTGSMTVTLTMTNGTLTVTGGAAGIAGSGTNIVTLTGAIADINATLASNVTYVQTADFNGAATLTMNTSDNGNTGVGGVLTDIDVLNINVTPVNDAPIAVTDTYTMAEDGTPITLTPLTGDSDPDGTTPTIQSINSVTLTPGIAQSIPVTDGTVNITAGGVITFTPDADFNGVVNFPYVITDGALTSTANQEITVTPVNDAPIAVTDTYTMAEDGTPITLTPLTGDSDPDGTTPTIQSINSVTLTPGIAQSIPVTDGTVNITAGGVITFTPDVDFNGVVNFPYVITDGALTSTANQEITVTPVNDAPTTTTDSATVVEGTTTAQATVLGNDLDPDGDAMTVSMFATNTSGLNSLSANGTNTVTTALGGTVVVSSDGTYTYTAPARDHADATADVDTFAYRANDGSLDSPWTTVSITITDTDPIANDDVDSVGTGSTVNGNVITGAGGVTADTLNVDSTHNLTDVVLTTGTQVSSTLNGATNVRTIVTNKGTLDIDLDDGSYTYTLVTPTNIVVDPATSTGVGSFTSQGIDVYGFDNNDFPYTSGSNNYLSDLDLSTLNVTSANRVTSSNDGLGVTATSGGTSQIQNTEKLVIDLGVESKEVTLTLNNFGTTEQAFYELYRADGTLISGGSQTGPNATASITLSAGEPFSYVILRSQGNNFRLDGIDIVPEPSGADDVFTYTLTDSDGSTDTATLTMAYDSSTTAVNDSATVYEAGIDENGAQAGGTAEATTTNIATGNLLANDTGVTATTTISVAGATGPDGNGVLTISDARGTVEIYTQDVTIGSETFSKGDYVVDITGRTTEGVDDTIAVNYTLTTGADTSNATLNVSIIDDAPVAQDAIVQVQQGVLPDTNLYFVIDSSGSMQGEVKSVAADGTVTISTRIQAAKDAVTAVINEYFSQGGNISITLIDFDFNNNTSTVGTFGDAATAIAALNNPANFVAAGGTDYEEALDETLVQLNTLTAAELANDTNTVYFISDGVPQSGDTTDPGDSIPNGNGYRDFVNNNGINSYAIGIGTGIADATELDNIHNIDSDNSGSVDSAIIVTNVAALEDVLLASVPTSFGGSVAGNASNSSLSFGADGGYIQNLVMNLDTTGDDTPNADVTFTYDTVLNQITATGGFLGSAVTAGSSITLNDANGFESGILTFNFITGAYVYQTAGFAAEGDQFDINFTAIDGDLDTASGTQTVQIVDGQPKANNDIDTFHGGETFFEGNVISGLGTDGGDSVQLTSFSNGRSGEDNPGDGGLVSSIDFNGATFDLTAAGAGTLAGGAYTVATVGGVNTLVWNATTGGASLTFNQEGYYSYTPPAAEISTNVAGTTTNYLLTSTAGVNNAAAAGMLLTGIARTSSVEGSAGITTSGDGVGVTGNTNTRVDALESLVITFDSATHPHGVQDVIIDLDGNSNLGGSRALSYTIYNVHGDLLGQFASNSEAPQNMGFENIGKIIIDSGGFSNPYGIVEDISFTTILDTAGTPAPAPEVITYTITDTDGDTSSATLTLNNIIDDIAGTTANETITGTDRNESISGFDGADTINAGAGYDIVRGGDGDDIIDGGADDDQLYGEDGDDTISGGTGADLINGDAGNDTLNGNDGADTIFGGAGNDIIDGGADADMIIGGAGNDNLTGGAGADVFKWELNDQGTAGTPALDVITDFDPAVVGGDVLDLRDLLTGEQHVTGIGNLESFLHFELVGSDTVIHVSDSGGFGSGYTPTNESQTITLTNVDLVSALGDDQMIIQDLLTNNKLIVD